MFAFSLCHAVLVLNEAVINVFQCWSLMHSISTDADIVLWYCVCVSERFLVLISL